MTVPLLLLIGVASPAAGWEFSATPLCMLRHDTEAASVRIIRDPDATEPYALTVTRAVGWDAAPSFALRFDGPRRLTIATQRHRLSPDRRTLTVTDRGFGNVLDGLEFNDRATAVTGSAEVGFGLDGAAEAVRAFRACRGAVPMS